MRQGFRRAKRSAQRLLYPVVATDPACPSGQIRSDFADVSCPLSASVKLSTFGDGELLMHDIGIHR